MKRQILIVVFLAFLLPGMFACSRPNLTGDRPAMLFFWSEHCAFCEEMMPLMDEFDREYGRQLDVIYVSVDDQGGQDLAREYGAIGTPTILLLNREGEQVQVLRGSLPAAVIEQAIEDLLAQDSG